MLPPPGRGPNSKDPNEGPAEIPPHLRAVPGKEQPPADATPPPTQAPAPAQAPVQALLRRRRPPQAALEPAQARVTQAEIVAFETVEAEVGGRRKLISILSAATLSKDFRLVLNLIGDPANDNETLARICALGKVSLAQLLSVFNAAAKTRGQVIAMSRVGERLPDVAAAVMEDAIPGWKQCPACLGGGQVTREATEEDPRTQQECPACKGLGQQWNTPEHDVQKTALKLGGLLDSHKGATLQVFNQNNQNNPGDTGNYDAMMSKLDDVIYGKGRERIRKSFEVEEGESEEGELADGE